MPRVSQDDHDPTPLLEDDVKLFQHLEDDMERRNWSESASEIDFSVGAAKQFVDPSYTPQSVSAPAVVGQMSARSAPPPNPMIRGRGGAPRSRHRARGTRSHSDYSGDRTPREQGVSDPDLQNKIDTLMARVKQLHVDLEATTTSSRAIGTSVTQMRGALDVGLNTLGTHLVRLENTLSAVEKRIMALSAVPRLAPIEPLVPAPAAVEREKSQRTLLSTLAPSAGPSSEPFPITESHPLAPLLTPEAVARKMGKRPEAVVPDAPVSATVTQEKPRRVRAKLSQFV